MNKLYKVLRLLGFIPFIIVLSYAIYNMFSGTTFIFTELIGFEAFYCTIIVYSIHLWPLYIIGLILIILSTIKLKKLNNK